MAITRRAILAGGIAAGAALTGEPAPTVAASSPREELERFLGLVAAARSDSGRLRSALESSAAVLGAARRRRLEERALEYGFSPQDFLTYALMDGLPLPRELLARYLPRGLVFAVPRQAGQGAMLGAAFLPTIAPLRWRQEAGYAGLSGGYRPGLHLGINAGLAMASLCGPTAELQSPGAPLPLAAEYALQTARSPEAALAVLGEMPPPRPGLHLLCDTVTGEVSALPVGGAAGVTSERNAPIVGGSLGPAGDGNLGLLQRHLQANLGWLTLEKALDVLGQALPGAVLVVLDLDGRRGRLRDGDEPQEVTF